MKRGKKAGADNVMEKEDEGEKQCEDKTCRFRRRGCNPNRSKNCKDALYPNKLMEARKNETTLPIGDLPHSGYPPSLRG